MAVLTEEDQQRMLAALESVAAEGVANETDDEIWRRYVVAARMSSPMVTAAQARDWANDMLKHDQARWPRGTVPAA